MRNEKKGVLHKIFSSEAAKAATAFLVCSFLQKGISILTTPIFTRLLNTEEYGYYSIFVSWTEILSVFSTLRLSGSTFMQVLVKKDQERDTATLSAAWLGSLCSMLCFAVYFMFREWINTFMDATTLIVICMFTSAWATLMFELWADRQRCENKYKPLIIITVVTVIAKPLCGISAILSTEQYKAEARILSLVLVEMLAYAWLFIYFNYRGKNKNIKSYTGYFLRMNLPLIPHYLTRILLNQCDRLMIKSYVGYAEAGIYSLGHSIAWMLTLATTSMLNVLNPWIFKKIKSNQLEDIAWISYLALGAVAVCGTLITLVAPEIVGFFAPKEYASAVWVIPPLCISVYFMFMYSLFATLEYYFEKTYLLTIASLFGGVLNVVLNFIFIKKYGYLAAGYTTLVCYLWYAVIHYICMKKVARSFLHIDSIYRLKTVVIITIIYLLINIIFIFLYKVRIMRYLIFLVIWVLLGANRQKIFSIVGIVRKEKDKA